VPVQGTQTGVARTNLHSADTLRRDTHSTNSTRGGSRTAPTACVRNRWVAGPVRAAYPHRCVWCWCIWRIGSR